MICEYDSGVVLIGYLGSGSILTALRARKPLLVISNTDLMDDHQSQLAAELEKNNYLTVTSIPYVPDILPHRPLHPMRILYERG